MTTVASGAPSPTCSLPFQIDGNTVRLRDDGSLAGTVTFDAEDSPTHGNLDVKRLGSGESTPVPTRRGRFQTRLTPIPIPPKVRRKGVQDVRGVVGMMYVLMERDGPSGPMPPIGTSTRRCAGR